jgi:hypothetical protein
MDFLLSGLCRPVVAPVSKARGILMFDLLEYFRTFDFKSSIVLSALIDHKALWSIY